MNFNPNIKIDQQQKKVDNFHKKLSHNINAIKLDDEKNKIKQLNKKFHSLNIENELLQAQFECLDELNDIPDLDDNYDIIENDNLDSQSNNLINQILQQECMKNIEGLEAPDPGIMLGESKLKNNDEFNDINI